MDIANRLDKAMNDAGFESQSALSRAAKVPQPTINRILKGGGKRGPESETVRKLAAACNVRFEWLLEGRGPVGRAPESASALPDAMRLKCEDLDEFKVLSMYRLANDTERKAYDSLARGIEARVASAASNKSKSGAGGD